MKKKVLFLCTHNANRSQMAEGLLRAIYGDRFDVYSAGSQPSELNPYAKKVLAETGIDTSGQYSKSVAEIKDLQFDYVVTVCDSAKETCPAFFGGVKYLHKSFDDPSEFSGGEVETLAAFRLVRDEIKNWIEKTFAE